MVGQQWTPEKHAEVLYVAEDFYLLRAPAFPAHLFTHVSASGSVCLETLDDAALDEALQRGERECADVVLALAAQPEIALALALASPSLRAGLERLQRGEQMQARQRRVLASLLRYLIRMSTRPTPFGLFAGVGLGAFAEQSEACLGPSAIKRFRTRPDMSWLFAVLRNLEQDPALVSRLQMRLNPTAYLVGERAVVPFVNIYGEAENHATSVRATTVVRKIFQLARQPLPSAQLRAAVQSAFPRATAAQIDGVLWQLWEQRFLISHLHPPLTAAQPAMYVRDQLAGLPGADGLARGLSQVLVASEELDRAGIAAPLDLVDRLVEKQEALAVATGETGPWQVDAALDLQASTLHSSIGLLAARAATFLLRQTPFVDGHPHLQEYRRRFQDMYGEGAQVPLLDLLSPENGLDAPVGYEHPYPTSSRPSRVERQDQSSRDRLLLELAMGALNSRSLEVASGEDAQHHLARWSPTVADAPLSLEISLHVHAASREALDRGEWSAVVGKNCGSSHGGRTFGRFFDLLGEPGLQALQSLYEREEQLMPAVVFAEMSYQPWQARQANVAIRPPLRSYEIVVGPMPSVPQERVIELSDLVVGVQTERFYVRSRRLGKQVRICQSHMLDARLAPNVCRFLSEVANDGLPQLSAFDGGAAKHAPFLPRLVIKAGETGRLVLTPACWHLQQETILPLGTGSEQARWFRGLQEWRRRWRVPRYVYLVEMDNRLLLDLHHPVMVEELRNELKKQQGHRQVTLDELLPDFEHLWLRDAQDAGYFSEIVVPLLRVDTGTGGKSAEHSERSLVEQDRVLLAAERRRFPGEDWSYVKVYAAQSQQEALIAGPLREVVQLLQERPLIDRWFFIRYADPDPHLRLRFHAAEGVDSQQIWALLLPWSVQLARRGLVQRSTLETYDREVEHYGGPAAIDLLEHVFTIDSSLVSALIAARYGRQLTLPPSQSLRGRSISSLPPGDGTWNSAWPGPGGVQKNMPAVRSFARCAPFCVTSLPRMAREKQRWLSSVCSWNSL